MGSTVESIPPGVDGQVTGVLHVTLSSAGTSKNEHEIGERNGAHEAFCLRWWSSASCGTVLSLHGGRTRAAYEIRCQRSQFVSFLGDCPQRQALEISSSPVLDTESVEGDSRVVRGFVPLASLIERLSASDDANFQVADIPVVLKPRPDSPNSPLAAGATADAIDRYIKLSVTIDVSFGDASSVGLAGVDGMLSKLQLGCGGKSIDVASTASTQADTDAQTTHASLVLGRDSLDDVSSEPGWPRDARRMDVQVGYVYFDLSHAPLHRNDNATVYLSLATQQSGKDQQRTRGAGFGERQKPGHEMKMLHASWKGEVVTFDPLPLDCGQSTSSNSVGNQSDHVEALRMSTDSHQSHQSSNCSPLSPTAKSPILRVSLWKSVAIVDQFHSFSDGGSPNDSLIGSAVVVVTGALGEEEGIEVPLYDNNLNKSGVVHLKIGTCCSMIERDDVSVDVQSRLNYEILSNMDALKRQVMPGSREQEGNRRYALSGSSDDSEPCIGVAYEGAVSDVEEGDLDDLGRHGDGDREHERGRIINDDWIFNIEKTAG